MAKNTTFKNMNVDSVINDLRQRITKPEHMLGRSLLQPYCNTNSGSRKLMHSTHIEQRMPLMHPEVPLIQTGYENEFGRYASSVYKAETDKVVLAKIQKFTNNPDQHYFLIVQDMQNGELDIIEKVDYEFITETYGYLNDNSYLNKLKPLDPDAESASFDNMIYNGEIYKKSKAYDEYNNRRDGVNLLTGYISTAKNTEDSVIISESAAKKLTSPLIKSVTIIINENDILLNIYGDIDNYKSFPDIGEEVKDGILAVSRREKKEESLFTHSFNRLNDFLMSDEKFMVEGSVIDIDIYCNNPETINQSVYNSQIKYYNDNKLRYMKEIVSVIDQVQSNNNNELPMSYKLKKFLYEANNVLNGMQYINDKPFTGTILKITILEENKIKVGDKVSDRYGGKGVISYIQPDNEMPIIANTGESVDILFNSCTCVGRLNPGQMFETSTTFIGKRLIDFILLNVLDVDQSIDLVREYMARTGTQMDEFLEEMLNPSVPEEMKEEYINSIVHDNGIMLSLEPISNSMTIDILKDLYDEFSWAKSYDMISPIKDSKGNIRYCRSRRPMIIGSKYIYRLKQYGEDKFSVTSSSATNIRNQNTRNKSNKQYKAPYQATPIKFGGMEYGNFMHMGPEILPMVNMIYSASPHARRSVQQMYTGDPFDVNIKIDGTAKNRNVEIINARLKTCGYRLVFKKVPKKKSSPAVYRIRKNIVFRTNVDSISNRPPVYRLNKNVVVRIPKEK